MDWTALTLSLQLAGWTVAFLLPISVLAGRYLAYRQFQGKGLVEALVMLPLVLPPTVFGFYLLVSFGRNSPVGQAWQEMFGSQLVFSFPGLVVASLIFNLPFAILPAQRGFQAIPAEVREAASCCGMSPLRSLWSVEVGRVGAILDSHYLSRDSGLAQSAITKLEKHRKSTDFPN